jgi:RNA polymerase sigma-B factor
MPATARTHVPRPRSEDDHDLTRAQRSDETAALLSALASASDPVEAEQLRERIVLINARVAEAVATRYERRGVPSDDLRQVAYEGLVKAVRRFDVTLRHDFLTFAVPTIRGELLRHFRDRGWTVRPPRRLQEIQTRAARVADRLAQDLGRDPTAEEVAAAIGEPVEDYQDAMAANGCFHPTSLDARTGAGAGTHGIGDLLPDDRADRDYEAIEAKATLAPVLRRLPERDRRILYLRFFEDRTQHEIGHEIGVTQMQVSRLLMRILDDVRRELEGDADGDPQRPTERQRVPA